MCKEHVLPRTEQACDAAQKADVAAVVMQEGLANVVLVTPAMTLLRAKVEVTIPRKRKGSCTQHEKVGPAPLPWIGSERSKWVGQLLFLYLRLRFSFHSLSLNMFVYLFVCLPV